MYSPVSENRHDSFLLSNSGLLNKLQEFMPDDAPEDITAEIFSLYGDPAFHSQFIFLVDTKILLMALLILIGTLKCPRFMRLLSGALQIFLHSGDFGISGLPWKIFQSPVAKYYIVAALLVNIQTCFYGNQTMEYFKYEAMSLDEYLSLID
jgi:hypothetical protein